MSEGFFPGTEAQALAMLYTQAQDLTGKSPSEIHQIYVEARSEISRKIKADAYSRVFPSEKE